ncbi:uncharacterized protein LOC143214952 [Lasioglossum baleicum]|uniref:uncharacterized protein LOC143214952 n=1 Tax=Lasioglossum baleicum TaxID=434251 RepID=UPI003FCDE3DE
MVPSKPATSSSRRSSILKPPKPRQPLQNVNFTESFNESSPVSTTKLKRRVSFAEKKHVKEFCNSLEQGTVWDSTYEEHDCNEGSYKENVKIRTGHRNDLVSDNPKTVDTCATKKSNICFVRDEIVKANLIATDHEAVCRTASDETESINKQLTEKEVLIGSSGNIFRSTAREIKESVLAFDLPVNSESYVHRRSVAFHDPDVNISSKVVNGQDSNGNNFKSNKLNATCTMSTQMDFTEAISHNTYSSINYTGKRIVPETLHNTSIQLLKNKSPISVELDAHAESPGNFNNLTTDMTMAVSSIPYNLQEKETYTERTRHFSNDSMETTAAVPTRWYNVLEKETYSEHTKNFKDFSMEMTAAVSTRAYNLLEKETYTERTKNFNNVSMDMTAAVHTRPYNLQEKETYTERTKNFKDLSMEMTTAVPTRPYNLQEKETYTERTKNFNDASMEMTAAEPTRPYSLLDKETYTERTKNFNNASMEMTAAVPTRPYNVLEKETYSEHPKNFNNASMEMTAAVSTRPYNLQEKETYTERTKNFNDASMEMTAAVSTKPYSLLEKETYTERTKNFNNVSMEMTAAVPTSPYNVLEKETYSEHMKNFNNASMDMTAAVHTRPYNLQEKETYTERTKNFKDFSMEMTAAVPTRPYSLLDKETYTERTKNFNDTSMEMTAAEPTRPYSLLDKETYTERTKNFNNASMEMTAAVPTRRYNVLEKETYSEHTKNFNNASMEMTAAVSTRPYNLQEQETYTERTKNFNDASMEMTAAVYTKPYSLLEKETYTERTKNFNNVSMEMTAAVPTSPYNVLEKETYSEHTKNFHNASMEMTTAVSTRPHNLQEKETYTERTKNFKDFSMEMTAPEPTRPYSLLDKETYTERSKYFNNASMEMTAAVLTRPYNVLEKETYSEHTENFNNASMEMTTTVSTRPYNLQEKETYTERTKNFKDFSMEMTAAVPTRPYSLLDKETYTERTKNFNNVSMEMTAAVPTRRYNVLEKETYSEHTKNFNNASMEMTAAVPTRSYNLQEKETYTERTNNFKDFSMDMTAAVPTKSHDLQEKTLSYDKMTSICHNVSMDVTEAVPINVYADRVQRDKIHDDILLSKTTIEQNENDITCMNDMMEITKSAKRNIFENATCLVDSHRTGGFDKTVMYNDKGMEFTAAISIIPKMQSGNLDVESDRTRIFHNDSVTTTAVVSCINNTDKTRIFQDNSMAITAVVPPLNKMDVSERKVENHESNVTVQDKSVLLPNNTMEMIKAIPLFENIPQLEDAITNMSGVTRMRLPENIENRSSSDSLNRFTIPDDVLRDITAVVVAPLLDSSESSEEKNCTMSNVEISEAKIVDEPSSSEVPSLVNIEANTALNDSPVQDISASALNLDNTGAVCATPNSASNDILHTVTPNPNQRECLPRKDTIPHPRRTYTIKSLDTDHSFTNNINKYSQSTKTNNDVQNTSSCQAQAFIGVEELQLITPPSFHCLNDFIEDVSVNKNCSREDHSFIKIVQDLSEKTLEFDQQNVVDESRKEKGLEAHRLRLSFNDSAITEVQAFEGSSSTTNINQNILLNNVVSPPRDKEIQNNSNTENQIMEQSVLDRDDSAEEKHFQSDEVTSSNAMKVDLQEIDSQISLVENDVSIELDPFSSLVKKLRACAESNEIIWEIYHENIEKKMFIAGFMSCSLLIVVYLGDDYDISGGQFIKNIKIISRLADDADNLISMVHRIILESIDVIKLIDLYKSVEDITSMLDYVSKEVKLAARFMFEVQRLEDLHVMEIARDSVSFYSHTKEVDTLLRVTVAIKPFAKIDSEDINVHCLLGSVREAEIKKLMQNIKKDHKFLRRFMNDVRDYIYLMEQSAFATNVS